MPGLNLTQADNGKSFEARQGDLIVIRLGENPTTGYRWTIDKSDDAIIALQTTDYTQAPSTGVGGGGQRTFTFKAIKPGAAKIALKLSREWEGDKSITDRFTASVQVHS
jgi:inhibitor of cysteine peptidase